MSESADGMVSTFSDRADAQGADLFILLERQLDQLLNRHRESRKTIEELQSALGDRERQASLLQQKLAQSEALRGQVATRIDALIAHIDQLQQAGAEGPGEKPEDAREAQA